MKKSLTILSSIIVFTIASNGFANLNQNNTIISNLHTNNNNDNNTVTSLFNNYYHYLNNDNWITNQSTVDHKFYSYDTNYADYQLNNGINARSVFMVDTTGNLVFNPHVAVLDKDKLNLENTKQKMIDEREVRVLTSDANHSAAYNFSDYQQNYFNDNNNWTYLQFGGLEKAIDISAMANTSKIENNNHLSENLGLFYIAKAVINNKIDLAVADDISQYFFKKSSLSAQFSNQTDELINKIIDLIYTNNIIFNFINSSPILSNIKDYSMNYVFDKMNNLVTVYYAKWNVTNLNQNLNVNYNNNFSSVNSYAWHKDSDPNSILEWTSYAKTWEQFVTIYPKFSFENGKLAINNLGVNKEDIELAATTDKISSEKSFNFLVRNDYNVTTPYYNVMQLASIQLYIWHDNQNIYYSWSAEVTSSPNYIAGCSLTIDLKTIQFVFNSN